jgi:hypothetical protein
LLISFNSVPANISTIYVVCFDSSDSTRYYAVKIKITLSSVQVNNPFMEPEQFGPTSLAFYDLTQVNDSSIVLKRMRPLFSFPTEQLFSINLHPDFYGG